MKKRGNAFGTVSLVMLFCVLCMIVFAVLTLSVADKELKMSELMVDRSYEYYKAESLASISVANLVSGKRVSRNVAVQFLDSDNTESNFRLLVPIREDQYIRIQLSMYGDGTFKIHDWETVNSGEWEPDNSIEVWDGFVW